MLKNLRTLTTTLGITTFSLVMFSCAQQDFEKLLHKGYKKNSGKHAYRYFSKWATESEKRITDISSIQNDTVLQAYEIYSLIYKPDSLEWLGGGGKKGEQYDDNRYIIAQGDIKIYITNQLQYDSSELKDFAWSKYNLHQIMSEDDKNNWSKRYDENPGAMLRFYGPKGLYTGKRDDSLIQHVQYFNPPVAHRKPIIYSSSEYHEGLLAFLGDLGFDNYYDADKKMEFLAPYAKVYMDLSQEWLTVSHPLIQGITFDENFEYAEVNYRVLRAGGEIFLKKENGAWKIISATRTWVESD